MTRVKILALLVGMVLLFTLPATVSAQRLPPHVIVGTAWIDDVAAPAGTTVSAWVGDAEAGTTTTTGVGGDYVLVVDQGDLSFAGETISFLIGGYSATQTAVWMQGGGDELTLSASSGPARGEVVSLALDEQNGSGQSGTATLTEVSGAIEVVLSLSAGTTQSEFVHIHTGQCGDTLGGVDFGLTSFVGGSGDSTSTVDTTLAHLQDGDHAINVHDLTDPGPPYTACGNIVSMLPVPAATGVPGEAGTTGPRGRAGRTGATGDEGGGGPTGARGDRGNTGSAGVAGDAGAKGSAGPAGSQGAAGAQGATGPGGAEGDDGSSALGVVALILAIIGIVGAGGVFLLSRRS
jgi:hypothetical protein